MALYSFFVEAILHIEQLEIMNTKLRQFEADVSQLDLLNNVAASSEDEQNAMLDNRDRKPFDPEWVRVDQAVKQLETNQQLSNEDKAAINELRETTFKKTYRVVENGELAGYVSDDFDLIARALIVDYHDAWLDALWMQYQTGNFPHGELLG
ncbi:MAG TPA: hypothetical protein VM821_02210 [Abditibacteriaceae bacterium]|nr:hypothetical protein [Abditibacteriaceae bacterium]